MPEDVNDNIGNAQFYNGNSAFYLATSRQMAGFRNATVNFSVIPIPTLFNNEVKPFKQIDVAFVSPKSNKKDNSYKLLADILDNSSEIVQSKGNQIPVLKKYAEEDSLANDEILQGFISQCNNAQLVPDIFEMTSVWNVVNANLSLLIQGDIAPKECADNIQKQIEDNIDFSRSN